MDKNSLKNISKNFFKEVSDKLGNQIKETYATSKDEFLEKGKNIVKTSVDDTVSNITNDLFKSKKSTDAEIPNQAESKERTGEKSDKNEKIDETFQKKQDFGIDKAPQNYQNAEQFEQNLHKNLIGMSKGLVAGNPAEVIKVLSDLISMAGDVAKFTEVQKTNRKEIEAKRDVYVEKIKAQKEIMLIYLEKSFDERKSNFQKLFDVVDNAIENNNMQQLSMGLNSINTLAASSPFKDLSSIESTQQALTDENHTWDF